MCISKSVAEVNTARCEVLLLFDEALQNDQTILSSDRKIRITDSNAVEGCFHDIKKH